MSSSSQFSSQDARAPGQPVGHGQLTRLAETSRSPVTFYIDGEPVQALAGDTLLTAILTHQRHVRISEFSGTPRAGFCMIGACQDCWVRCETTAAGGATEGTEGGQRLQGDAQLTRLRACSTTVQPGMRIVTRPATADEVHGGSHA